MEIIKNIAENAKELITHPTLMTFIHLKYRIYFKAIVLNVPLFCLLIFCFMYASSSKTPLVVMLILNIIWEFIVMRAHISGYLTDMRNWIKILTILFLMLALFEIKSLEKIAFILLMIKLLRIMRNLLIFLFYDSFQILMNVLGFISILGGSYQLLNLSNSIRKTILNDHEMFKPTAMLVIFFIILYLTLMPILSNFMPKIFAADEAQKVKTIENALVVLVKELARYDDIFLKRNSWLCKILEIIPVSNTIDVTFNPEKQFHVIVNEAYRESPLYLSSEIGTKLLNLLDERNNNLLKQKKES